MFICVWFRLPLGSQAWVGFRASEAHIWRIFKAVPDVGIPAPGRTGLLNVTG